MFQKILLATDGSKHAYRAAEKAVELALQLGNVSVTLFHVTPEISSKNSLIQADFDILSLLKKEARLAIIKTELLFKQENIPCNLAVGLGDPAEEIVQKAQTEDYDLLIVGSRGLNKLQEFVIGSVSKQVVHMVKCPVMIIK
jgi:nucleotide-binding universal stress UspA family protein